jgi:hypothetical protein
MNNISDFEAHRRDEEYERIHGAQLDRQWDAAPKCPTHGVPLVLGFGIGGERYFFPEGKCPECFWAERRTGATNVSTR